MTTNVWGTDYRCCVSERAFDDYQTRDEQRELMQAYRRARMKRFHYTNSATLEYTHVTWFVSYYTFIFGYTIDNVTKNVFLYVEPFVFMKDSYRNSPTTNKQANRWLQEHGFEFTIKGISNVYNNSINGIASYPMQRYVKGNTAVLVLPVFNHTQIYLNEDGTLRYDRATNKVPNLAYNEYYNSLVRIGDTVITKDMKAGKDRG